MKYYFSIILIRISLFFLYCSLRLNLTYICVFIILFNIRKIKRIKSTSKTTKKILVFDKVGGIEDLISSFNKSKNHNLIFFMLPRIFLKEIYAFFFRNCIIRKDYFTKPQSLKEAINKKKYINFLSKIFTKLDKFIYIDGFISFNIFYYAEKDLDQVAKNIKKKFIVLHKESALTPIEEKNYPLYYKLYNNKSLAYKISVYSQSQKNILIKSNIANKSQVFVNGCPRSDFSFRLKNSKPNNNTIVFYLIEFDRYTQNKFQKLFIKKELNWKKLFYKTVDYLLEFAEKNPDIEIIFKGKIGTHNKNLFSHLKLPVNCKYIYTGTGEKILKKSKIVIAFNSTIVFETIASNRNLIIPNFHNENIIKKNYVHQIKDKKIFINTKTQFFSKLNFYLSKNYKRKGYSKNEIQTLKYYLGNIDGTSSAKMKKFLINSFN